jgi:hypothetical protein
MLDTILEAAILIVVFLEYIESMKMRKLMEQEANKEAIKQHIKEHKKFIDPMGDRIGF